MPACRLTGVIGILEIPRGAVVLILALIRKARKGIRTDHAYTMLSTFGLFRVNLQMPPQLLRVCLVKIIELFL
ncbi:hypothetical protein BGP76_02155 [Reichenbachiella sp. MSK19-1]|nr:hypothetical protein BGP76_02155 [Reichenbachiella sp. MSK19-1]